jgi:hypothetical protein
MKSNYTQNEIAHGMAALQSASSLFSIHETNDQLFA